MADRSLRGARLGSASLQSEEGVVFADRKLVQYRCPQCGHTSDVIFAAEAESPDAWECRNCGHQAARVGADDEIVADVSEPATSGRTPWEMLLERRSIPELEELLQERLDWLRSRRGDDRVA